MNFVIAHSDLMPRNDIGGAKKSTKGTREKYRKIKTLDSKNIHMLMLKDIRCISCKRDFKPQAPIDILSDGSRFMIKCECPHCKKNVNRIVGKDSLSDSIRKMV